MTKRTLGGGEGPTIKSGDDTPTPGGVRPPPRPAPGVSPKTALNPGGGRGPSAPSRFSDKTQVFGGDQAPPAGTPTPDVAGTGRGLTGGQTRLASDFSGDIVDGQPTHSGMEDPTHGWLVIVDGPGKGNSMVVGGGRSAIGRGADQHISLPFGDETISRDKHCWLSFDIRAGKYYISAGDGRNLAYVNSEPVLTSLEVKTRDEILIGETKMIFMAFCGEEFSWA